MGWRESWPGFDHCKSEANIRREQSKQSNYLLASLYNAAIELSVSHIVKMGIANWRASFHPDSCVLKYRIVGLKIEWLMVRWKKCTLKKLV